MSNLDRAIEIAVRAHAGQLDKAGQPYILHPLAVMLSMSTEVERIVAVLHDVVEDCGVTLDQLRAEGFVPEVVSGVDAVTRRSGETYADFVIRAGMDPIGRRVKIRDLRHNADIGRIAEPTAADYARTEKYRRAIEQLEAVSA
ncbi:HD domain-containing protein [Duganella vulcania]|uniref:HD domain-containing protein n=1 Tax=Duganella vulcania TaxID=2692166 RepID=UPI0035316139